MSIPDGNYFINVRFKVASSVDISGASTSDSTTIQLYSGNGSKAQQFKFSKQSDGSYVITNVNSDKALDVRGAAAGNNSVVQQYAINGTNAQRWFIRDSG
ncbi:MAG: RICIN domain-containing protein, partial [Escherichia coli]|nr:RICIN domain-containing protein [Escherichia coli]